MHPNEQIAFHLDELKTSADEVQDFDVNDLARVLDMDPSRFVPPVVDSAGKVLRGGAYVEALRLCQRTLVMAESTRPPGPSERLRDDFLFFEELHWNFTETMVVFDRYEAALREALIHPNGPRGEVWRVEYTRLEKDLVRIIVRGRLNSDEDLMRLTPPTRALLDDLKKYAGPIRSLNGWKGIL